MRKKDEFTIDVVSGIDDDIVTKNLQKRFELWFSRGKKPKRNKWIPILSAAASFAIVLTSAFLLWNFLKAPVYLGMTVSNEAPVVNSAMVDTDAFSPIALSADDSMLMPMHLNNTNSEGNNGNHGSNDTNTTEATTTNPPPEVFESETYYAMPGEDIYIYVHISNPNEYEILSFTLNGVKYSSYMFEPGSDLETLILKCNVGDVEGVMQYTIDAIKYVDGEAIKDVRMKGDQTIEVMVGHSADSYLGFNTSLMGFDVNIEAIWKDGFEGDKEILSLGVYDGETLVKELAPTDRVIKGLPSNSRFVLIATYKNGEITETVRHIFDTRKCSEGLIMYNGYITAIGTCQDPVLYLDASIGANAFLNNTNIKEVYLGNAVTSIDSSAFKGCTELVSVVISDSVTSMGASVFEGCESLGDITLSAGLDVIPEKAFYGTGLTEIEISEAVTTIGSEAFASCNKLKTVTLSDNLKTIGSSVFEGCIQLEEITLPDNIETISSSAFANCTRLKTITLPNTLETIGASAFAGCISLEEIALPDTLKIIENGAFFRCVSLTGINIPNGVTTIQGYTFGESGLTSIVLHDGIISIGERAFLDCSNLREVTLGANLRSIGHRAFDGCKQATITFNNTVSAWNQVSQAFEWWTWNGNIQCTDGTGKAEF